MDALLKREDLHEYQEFCVRFLLEHPMACLFLDCGLGKTIITLTAILELMFDLLEVSRVLVVTPLRVAQVWKNETEKWEHLNPLTVALAIGTAKEREAAIRQGAMITVINRENLKWLQDYFQENRIRFPYDMIVVDELSGFKSGKSQRFKVMRQFRSKVNRIVGLTGTPAPQSLLDLWSEIGIIDKGERLGRFIGRYREKYFKAASFNPQTGIVYRYEPREGAEQEIYTAIGDITVSMKALDYLDMPDCVHNKVEVTLSPAERRAYDMLKKELIIPLDGGDVDAANAAALSNKLLQMSGGAVYDENHNVREFHRRKIDALEDLIEAANGQNVLIAYWFKHERDRIMAAFPKLGIREIRTEQDIEDWNAGKINVALLQPQSCGMGVNLQYGGRILIWYSQIYNLESYQQTNARLWRQGQTGPVTIHHIVLKDSIDEDVLKALERKDTTQENLIAAVKARLL